MDSPPATCQLCGGAGYRGFFGHVGFGLIKFPCPDCSAAVTLADKDHTAHHTPPVEVVAFERFDIHFDDKTIISSLLAGGAGACCVGMVCGVAPLIIGLVAGLIPCMCLWAASGCALLVCYVAGIFGKNTGRERLGTGSFCCLRSCSSLCGGLNVFFVGIVLLFQFVRVPGSIPWMRDLYEVCCNECHTYCLKVEHSPICMQAVTLQQPSETSRKLDCNSLPPIGHGTKCSLWAVNSSEPLVPKCSLDGDCVIADWCDTSSGHPRCYHDKTRGANHFGPCHSLEAINESGAYAGGCIICYVVAVIAIVSSVIVCRSARSLEHREGPFFTIASKPPTSTVSTPAQPPAQAVTLGKAGATQRSKMSTTGQLGSAESPPLQAIVLGRAVPPQMFTTSTSVSSGSAAECPANSMVTGQAATMQSPAENLDLAVVDMPSSDIAIGGNAGSDSAIQKKQPSTALVYAKTNWKSLFVVSACIGNLVLIILLMVLTIPTILGNSPW